MEATAIKASAGQFDPQQPSHPDEAAARASLSDGPVASGWHTAAPTRRLLVEGGAGAADRRRHRRCGGEIAWPQPTRPGDVLRVESEVLAVTPPSRSRPDRGIVTLRSTPLNQDGEAVQILTARLVVPRRSVPTG